MPTQQPDTDDPRRRLRTARVVHVEEDACSVWSEGRLATVEFAALFPSPRVERVSPGHLVAIATSAMGAEVVVWRWYDAVVVGHDADGSVRLWEAAHGQVIAQPRSSYTQQEPGSRAFASAGLAGAEWWVACGAAGSPYVVDVDLDAVDALYSENGLWSAAFGTNT
jgi:hypothetical protein